MSVLDGALKVYGGEHLRIADASIMPRVTTLTTGNSMAACVVSGERAADILNAQHTLKSSRKEQAWLASRPLSSRTSSPRAARTNLESRSRPADHSRRRRDDAPGNERTRGRHLCRGGCARG